MARLHGCKAALTALFTALALAACGGGGGVELSIDPADPPGPGNPGGPGGPGNDPPDFTSAGNTEVPENEGGVFYTATASDADGDALGFSLDGGADAELFDIADGGALSFVQPPDHEFPLDADGNNVYEVTLAVSDGQASATLPLEVRVTDVASTPMQVRRVVEGLDQPVFVAPMPGSSRLFVLERAGRILLLDPATGAIGATPFLDLSGLLSTDGERGLLGFATAPDFIDSGIFYVYVTVLDGTIEVRRYRTAAGDRSRADPDSGDVILRIPHPRSNHNGGWMGFGPDDDWLYIATGDGGGTGDPDDNAQNPDALLGKMLRIDPAGDDFPLDQARDYAIPLENPYAGGGGAPEVLALGLRNPFRNSFDPRTGNLWIGDVGQNAIEEVDLLRPQDAGTLVNYGWPILEGTEAFDGGNTSGLLPPVTEYRHGDGPFEGRTVIGGHVYRGRIEQLTGLYVFADFINPNVWTVPATRLVQGETLPSSAYSNRDVEFMPEQGSFDNIVSFGVDQQRDLYLVDFDGEIFVIEPEPQAASAGRVGFQPLHRWRVGTRCGTIHACR